MPALVAQGDEQNIDRGIAGLNRTELASPTTADGGRSAPISLTMIRNFADHSANERTFLAWVRTAIAVMAFGFIVEKFDLFLEVAAPSLVGRPLSLPGHRIRQHSRIGADCSRHRDGRRRGCALSDHRKKHRQRTAAARHGLAHRYRARCPARPAWQRSIRLSLARLGHKAVTPAARQLARATSLTLPAAGELTITPAGVPYSFCG